MFKRYWSHVSDLAAKWKFDGVDPSLGDDARYWEMSKKKWTCAACGKEGLKHQPSMHDGTDGKEYPRVRFLEDGTSLCMKCMEPLDTVRIDLEQKILKLHPDWNPPPPICFICGKSGRNQRMQFVKDKGVAHLDCISEHSST